MDMTQEQERGALPGILGVLLVFVVVPALAFFLIRQGVVQQSASSGVGGVALGIAWFFLLGGFFIVEPNGSKVLILFGRYKGTVKDNGFFWANPFMVKRPVSLRARTLNGEKLKVNDAVGNPIEIAAVIVWKVSDTY